MGGAFWIRHTWRKFRGRFDGLRLVPLLDYARYQEKTISGKNFRFLGGMESLTDEDTLWVRNRELTIPVALHKAHAYMLPQPESGDFFAPFDPGQELPRRVHWGKISTINEGAKVFIGGRLELIDDRLTFVSTKEEPLLIIFYDGPDSSLTVRAIRAGRHTNEYWNRLTPYALALGISSQLLIALSYMQRPAFRLSAITAFAAAFGPLFPLVPPGVLFTVICGRLWWRARIYRAYRDLVRLPLKYIPPDKDEGSLPDNERYGYIRYAVLPPWVAEAKFPLTPPGVIPRKHEVWYVYGTLPEKNQEHPGGDELDTLLLKPDDPFATYGAIPGDPKILARRYTVHAYVLEILSCILMAAGIGLNCLFVAMILFFLL
ncbi:hypothetical protein JFL75_05700 [Breznakiella homolactica]|uniref:Uncharacterized protein n=1 Tax=Breznakiella homolactica TaxID=2798577 RepID=A0A7T7XRU9_9SPIR|nr:hypothetical protein JFL75_05700 [Breznakiella homolactica]